MDDRRFDAALRALDRAATRRRGIAAALGVMLGAASVDASAKGRTAPAGGPAVQGPCGDGSWQDNKCRRGKDCCTGYCEQVKSGKVRIGLCRYARTGDECNRKTTCRNNAVCYKGVCTLKRDVPGGTCKRCSGGCCQGSKCAEGTSSAACGLGGEPCVVCPSNWAVCASKACAEGTWSSSSQAPSVPDITGLAVSQDQLTLYATQATISTSAQVSIWTRASTSAAWTQQTTIGSYGTNADQFNYPSFLLVSPDNLTLYVSDAGNNWISIWSRPSTSANWTWQANVGSVGAGDANFNAPAGIALSPDQLTLYVADAYNFRISIWQRASTSQAFQPLTRFGAYGSGDGQFTYPQGIALAPDQKTLFVADPLVPRVVAWSRSTTSSTDWAQAGQVGGGEGTANDQFSAPASLAIASDSRTLYMIDGYNPYTFNNNKRASSWNFVGPDVTDWEVTSVFGSTVFDKPGILAVAPNNLTMYVSDVGLSLVSTWIQQ
ncbi:MAG: NHL repeat-containing protein [Chloroflexota bacterium]